MTKFQAKLGQEYKLRTGHSCLIPDYPNQYIKLQNGMQSTRNGNIQRSNNKFTLNQFGNIAYRISNQIKKLNRQKLVKESIGKGK